MKDRATISYNFPDNYDIQMVDVFRRVKFTNKTSNNAKNFEPYLIKDGFHPEDVAADFYGRSDLWWLVLLSNNIIDVENEWPKSMTSLQSLFSNFLNGWSYYMFESLDLLPNDIIVKRDITEEGGIDTDNFSIVDKYDKILHKIDVKNFNGEIIEGDEVYIFRSNAEGEYELVNGFGSTGCFKPVSGSTNCIIVEGPDADFAPLCATAGVTYGKIYKREAIKESVVEFKYNSDPISPYSEFTEGIGVVGDYFDFNNLCGMTGTILYQYINDTLSSSVEQISTEKSIMEKNDKLRNIHLLVPSMTTRVVNEIDNLLRDDIPRGTTSIIELR
jgi:hypothetical protein